MVGAQKGALLLGVDIFSLNFIGLFGYLSPAFAPKAIVIIGKATTIRMLYNEAGR